MEKYEEPMIEIIPFEANDIICASGCVNSVHIPGENETELAPAG